MVTNHDYSQLTGIPDDSRVFSDDDGKRYSVVVYSVARNLKKLI